MASLTKFSYQRLRNEKLFDEDETEEKGRFKRIKGWCRLGIKLTSRKRPSVRIPGLKKFLRRKARFLSAVRVSWGKALKRLKKSQLVHINDLLAGNYMFMHVTPAPLKCVDRSTFKGSHHHLHGLSSRYSLGRIA